MTPRTAERTALSNIPIRPPTISHRTELSDATRYLCVGAHLDEIFRDRCLREVYYQGKRRIAPSYGFDVVLVLDQCLRARNLAMCRDAAILVTVAAAAYLNWISVVALAAALICLRTTRAAWRIVRDYLIRVSSGAAVDTTKSSRRGLVLLLGWATLWIALIAATSKIASSASLSLTQNGDRDISIGNSGALLLALLVFALPLIFALLRQKRIESLAFGGRPPDPRPSPRMQEIDRQQRARTVVYGGFEPFVGSGEVMATWGFAQRLVRKAADGPVGLSTTRTEGEREFDVPPFTAESLIRYLRRHLEDLTSDGMAEQRIPDMTIEDRIFLSSREFGDRGIETTPERMADIIRNPTMPARHYLTCQVVSWGGELVTTVHVHIAIQGRSLYLELTSTFLPPCNERYRIVDMDGGTGLSAWVRVARNAIADTPRTIVRAPRRLVRSFVGLLGASGSAARTGLSRRRFDYGTRTSVREIGTKDRLRNFTQRQDVLKFKRLIERRVIAHVLDFLDEHDVDTTEYRDRAASVLNVGVGHFGTGDMTFSGQVTGQQVTGQQTGNRSSGSAA